MAFPIFIHPDNPQSKRLEEAAKILAKGGVIIIPTDTIYSFAADINHPKALEKIAKYKGEDLKSANLSFLFNDLSQVSDYTMQFDTHIFKILKRGLPGPFTFILNANKSIPKLFHNKKKTIGIRVPDNNITRGIVEYLGHPIATTSVHDDDEIIEYTTDPELIFERHQNYVDAVINGGIGNNIASTVIDLTSGDIEVLREGLGNPEILY